MKPGDLVCLTDIVRQSEPDLVLWSESLYVGEPTGEWTPRDTGIILEIKEKYLQLTEWYMYRVLVGSAIGWVDYRNVELVEGDRR